MAKHRESQGAASAEEEEGVWQVQGGVPRKKERTAPFSSGGAEGLTYNNPFNLEIERVWCDGKVVFAVECGELDVPVESVKVAQEYQIVYGVELDERGRLKQEPDRVDGQYNIYDSVPGMPSYSPLWQFNYVVVPRDYRPNTFRSERDCLESGYPIRKSTVIEN